MNSAVTTRQAAACEGAPVIGPPAAQGVAELGWGMWASGMVRAAAELRIADALDEQPTTVAEIAGKIDADQGALTRLMRALAAFGIFQPVGTDSYQHTESSRALRSDADVSVADILLTGSYWGALMWSMLAESVRTGECAFEQHYGKDLFTYFHEDDNAAGEQCLRGYAAMFAAMTPAVVAALDLSGVEIFCDVGGGHGSLVRSLLEANPATRAVLYDRPHAINAALPQLREGPLADRCELMIGDCLASVPSADLYVIRQVLHMWTDERCLKVLGNCVRAARPGVRVVLLEQLIADPPETPWDALMDLHMLLVMGGWERTVEQYADLFHRVGLEYAGVTPTGTPLRAIEGRLP